MKILLPGLLLFSTSASHCDYSEPYAPIDPEKLDKVSAFIPEHWRAIAVAEGDLNQDKQIDYALIIQKTDPANIQSSSSDPISRNINTNPRHLLLLFTIEEDNQKKLIRKRIYRKFVPTMNITSPNMVEPVSYIGINEGLFEIRFISEPQDNSWSRENITYHFAYHKKSERFKLTGYEKHAINKATAMFEKQTIDLANGQQENTYGSMSSPRHRKDTLPFKAPSDWTICDIKKPLTFKPDYEPYESD